MDLKLPPENFGSSLLQKTQEVILEDGTVDKIVDLHTSATIISYIAANDPENIKANTNLATLVFLEDTNVDLTSLMTNVRRGCRASTLRLIALVKGGLDIVAAEAINNQ